MGRGRGQERYYHPPGRKVAARVPEGRKMPQEQTAETCGRCRGAQPWPRRPPPPPCEWGDGSVWGHLASPRTPRVPGPAPLQRGEGQHLHHPAQVPCPLCPRSHLRGWERSSATARMRWRKRLSPARGCRAPSMARTISYTGPGSCRPYAGRTEPLPAPRATSQRAFIPSLRQHLPWGRASNLPRGLFLFLLMLLANRCQTRSCSSVAAQGIRAHTVESDLS